jgi:hypothetical protein
MTRVTTGTGLRHTARRRDGDRATRDSYGHAYLPHHTSNSPSPTLAHCALPRVPLPPSPPQRVTAVARR